MHTEQARYVLARRSVRLPDDVRYAMLCGALAHEYGALFAWPIDPRITARGIVLGGGPPLMTSSERSLTAE